MKHLFVVLCLLFFSSFALHAQSEDRRLTVLNRTMNFGNVMPDSTLVAKFFFVNSGTQKVEIEYVNPDCTCAGYRLSSKTLNPRDTAYVELQVKTSGRFGRHRVHSTMKANTPVGNYLFTVVFTVMD